MSAKERWTTWLVGEFDLPSSAVDVIADQLAIIDEGYGKAMERAIAAEGKLEEALERDAKGDTIIHELTLERDQLAGRLDAAHKELHDALHDQALLNRALAAEAKLDALRKWFEYCRTGLFSDQVAELELLLNGAVERRDPFDEAIERDAKAGKLDGLIAEAKERLGE